MDPKVVAKIHDAFKKALEEQPVIDSLASFDMVPNYKGTADYTQRWPSRSGSRRRCSSASAWRRRIDVTLGTVSARVQSLERGRESRPRFALRNRLTVRRERIRSFSFRRFASPWKRFRLRSACRSSAGGRTPKNVTRSSDRHEAVLANTRKGCNDANQQDVCAAAAVAAAALFDAEARAQDYPAKPITLIVPWPAGGSTDITMRAIAEVAAKHLGQPVIIDNKAGGAGTVGPATMAASAKPDGYTIAQIPITVFRMPLMQQTPWDAEKDFTYIIHLTGYTLASPRAPRARSRPGRTSSSTPRPIPAR